MPKINNPGCGCCQPPCITECGDGSSDEIAEWEWSIADLPTEFYAYIKLDYQTVSPPITDYWIWYRLKITGYPAPTAQGLAELNGIYIIDHDLVTCQKPTVTDTTLVQVDVAASDISYTEDFCPDFDAYSGGYFAIWRATSTAYYTNWGIYFDKFNPPNETTLQFRLRFALNAWSQTMFDARVALGGDGLCTSKTYQAQPPWVPGTCTVDETRQTFNNVYTVTPA